MAKLFVKKNEQFPKTLMEVVVGNASRILSLARSLGFLLQPESYSVLAAFICEHSEEAAVAADAIAYLSHIPGASRLRRDVLRLFIGRLFNKTKPEEIRALVTPTFMTLTKQEIESFDSSVLQRLVNGTLKAEVALRWSSPLMARFRKWKLSGVFLPLTPDTSFVGADLVCELCAVIEAGRWSEVVKCFLAIPVSHSLKMDEFCTSLIDAVELQNCR